MDSSEDNFDFTYSTTHSQTRQCPCGSTEFMTTDGTLTCSLCGLVLESTQQLVSEIQFDQHGGKKKKVGTEFGETEKKRYDIENQKRQVRHYGSMLKMNSTLIERGVRLYEMILSRGKSKGRSFKLTAAACLYIICRENGTDHLLIDFADVFSVKVKPLGRTFLRLCEELKYELPFVDPCLYLHRFAQHLGFEKIEEVNKTAMRICQRMNRDWMHYGRRPSGICGVALYLAAKLHNEPKTLEEIVKVVRLSTTTVRVRLKEFLRTPSADLSLQQLNKESDANEKRTETEKVYSSEPCLPPSYMLNRMKDKARETIGINIPLKKRKGNNDEYEAAEDKALTEEIENLIGGEVNKIMECKNIDEKPHDLGTLEGKCAEDVGIQKESFDVEKLIDINKMKEEDFSSEEGVDEGECALGDCTEFDKELDSYFLDTNESEKRKQIWEELNAEFLEREKKRIENGEEIPRKRKKEKKPKKNHQNFKEAMQEQLKKRSSRINWDVLHNVMNHTEHLLEKGVDVKIEMKEEDDDSLFTEHLNLGGDSNNASQMNNNNNSFSGYNSQNKWDYDDDDE